MADGHGFRRMRRYSNLIPRHYCMENLCWNRLLVEGAFADRREFEVWNETTVMPAADSEQLTVSLPPYALEYHIRLGFNAMVPVPFDLAMFGGAVEAAWRLRRWGTCGNPDGLVDRIDDGHVLTYVFHTNDGPPREWLFAVSIRFPNLILTLQYAEPTRACAGTLALANNGILEDVEAESEDDAAYIAREWFGLDDTAFQGG